jgi:hypothetical protein
MKQDSIISPSAAAVKSAEIRLEKQDWQRIGSDLNSFGCAVVDKLLTRAECREIAALYPQEDSLHRLLHDEASAVHCATQDPDSPQFCAQEKLLELQFAMHSAEV